MKAFIIWQSLWETTPKAVQIQNTLEVKGEK